MAPPRALFTVILAALALAGSSGCNAERAFSTWVMESPEPVRFAATDAPPVLGPAAAARVAVGSVTSSPRRTVWAGDVSGGPNRIPVPFDEATPPVEVLRADLERLLGAAEPDAARALRLDAVLVQAYVHRTYHVWKSSRMVGEVVLDVTLVDPGTGAVRWSHRASGTHEHAPAYITGEAVEVAVDAAYSEALAELGRALATFLEESP